MGSKEQWHSGNRGVVGMEEQQVRTSAKQVSKDLHYNC